MLELTLHLFEFCYDAMYYLADRFAFQRHFEGVLVLLPSCSLAELAEFQSIASIS